MKKLLRLFLLAALAIAPANAWAASGATTVNAEDSSSTARAFNVVSTTGAVTGNLSWMNSICDFTTLTQCAAVDSSGGLSIKGEGTAGTAAGGVLTVQGVASMTPFLATGTGTAGTAASGVVTVQGIASMTPFLVNPGTAANWGVVTQGSTTSGQSGNLVQCATTTSAPTYTTADTNPLNCDTSGNIRVNVTTATGLAQGSTTSGQTGSLVMGAVTTAAPSYTTAQTSPVSLDTNGNTRVSVYPGAAGAAGYPIGATPYTATATGTTAATTATLTGASSVTTYICGFSIRANATAAATGNATVTGVITATINFTQWTAPLASGIGVTEEIFNPCIPASGTDQSIAVVSAAPGSGGTVSVTAWGFKL